MKQTLLLAAALVALPIAAVAQTGLTPEQIVAARQSAYGLSAANFAQLKAQADAGVDVHTLAFPARQLARWARTLPTMFPAGTNLPTSHALPTVWSDRAGFEAKAADYAAAATKLAELAKASDKPGFTAQFAVVGATCKACHDSYRKPDQH